MDPRARGVGTSLPVWAWCNARCAQLLRLRVLFRTPLAHVMSCKNNLQLITANRGLVDRSTRVVRSIARSPSMMREYAGRYED